MEQKQESPKIDVGGILRDARERMGMSVEDVAGRLKFAPRQITALEEGAFDQLPEPAFVRGFVRSYARLVQVEEAALLQALPSPKVQEAPVERAAKRELLPGAAAVRAQNVRWLAGALAVALVLGVLAWQHEGTQVAPKPQASAKVEPEAKPAAGPENSALPPALPASAPLAAQAGEEHAAHPGLPAAPVVRESAKPAVAAPASAVAAARENAARKHSGRLLRLEFDEDSWVEVKDANGKILLSMLGKQGTTQSVSGAVPLSVTVGNAKGVKLYYKGELLELDPEDTAGNVAHMVLE